MEYHYVVSNLGGIILAVYGKEFRENAFESAAQKRASGTPCEVFTRCGKRQSVGASFNGKE